MIKKVTISFIVATAALLAGCETAPTQSQYQSPKTPLQICLDEAKRAGAICGLGALGSGQRFNDATAQKNVRICEDRELTQQDRCYARFK